MVRICTICKNKKAPFFEIPVEPNARLKWLEFLKSIHVTKISQYSILCKNHFDEFWFDQSAKICRLKKGAVPSLPAIESRPSNSFKIESTVNSSNQPHNNDSVPINSSCEIIKLQETCKDLKLELEEANKKLKYYHSLIANINQETKDILPMMESIKRISTAAKSSDEKAQFILDIVKNYTKKSPRWSELSIRTCTTWQYSSPRGYKFCSKNLIRLPSKNTISRYLREFNG